MSQITPTMLLKYVKNRKGQRIGVVLAIGKDKIGWSKCNFSMGDKFDREKGRDIALGRAEKYNYTPLVTQQRPAIFPARHIDEIIVGGVTITDEVSFCNAHHIAHDIRSDFIYMVERAKQYFQDNE